MHETSTAPIPVTTEAAVAVAVTIRDTALTGKEVYVCCIIQIHVSCYLIVLATELLLTIYLSSKHQIF